MNEPKKFKGLDVFWLPIGLIVGNIFGVVFGMIYDNMGLFISIGATFGLCAGLVMYSIDPGHKKNSQAQSKEKSDQSSE